MVYRNGLRGDTIIGLLNDFDLSTYMSEESKTPTSNQRTGNLSFMALDLLDDDPPPHMYRHDLESQVYVLIYITTCYANGQHVEGAPYAEWNEVGRTGQRKQKNDLQRAKLKSTASYQPLMSRWIYSLRKCFREGYNAQAKYQERGGTEPSETLHGHVTFDILERIYNTNVPDA